MKLILHREDLPTMPTPDTVHFVLSFEGGKPLEGRLENLRNFYSVCGPCRSPGIYATSLRTASRRN
jgi:hypothetical protein